MPTPSIPKVIKLDITKGGSTSIPASIAARAYNRTTKATKTEMVVSGKALFAFNDDEYTVGDVIEFSISGAVIGNTAVTTSGTASQTAAITTADTSATGFGGIISL